jgi:hypothetical protein
VEPSHAQFLLELLSNSMPFSCLFEILHSSVHNFAIRTTTFLLVLDFQPFEAPAIIPTTMDLWKLFWASLNLLASCLAADQDILTILNQQTGVSDFVALLSQNTDLVDVLNRGTFSCKRPV